MMAPSQSLRPDGRLVRIATLLWLLLGLFGFRVGAQSAQKYWPVKFLPAYAAWQSGTLPYGLLLAIQAVMLVAMTSITVRLTTGRMMPKRKTGEVLLALGSFYFAFMLFRFGASLSFAKQQAFLGATIPAVFHLVLSGWLLTLGLYHRLGWPALGAAQAPEKMRPVVVQWLTYPTVMAFCLWLHLYLLYEGAGLQLSTYLPLAAAAGAIALLERRFPYREEWQPQREDIKNDVTFMVLVQILLPKILAFLVAIKALGWLQARGIALDGFWPHQLPALVQAGLMILVVDFMRYWLHRASHEWSPTLWRLHAVHHSPHKLYWVNVARFHPIEKSFQFLLDAAPFMLLGVSEEVLALYFICYSTNGFFQHSNVELRLGWMNYLVAGPELHRWHHSWEARESNRNYGNNIILWDLLFGSYFLPGNREVGALGLRNRDYPHDFLRQMRTPFIKGSDQAGG